MVFVRHGLPLAALVGLVGLVGLAIGCEAPSRLDRLPLPGAAREEPATTAHAHPQLPLGLQNLAAPTASPAPAPEATAVVPKRLRKSVDETLAQAHPAARHRLTEGQLAHLAQTTVPVLWPDLPAFLDRALATADGDWFSLSSTYDGATVVVQGDRLATLDPEMIPAGWVAPTWNSPLVGRNEGIVEATFLAWGASYAVSIECADPAGDVRCTQDAAVLELVGQLRRWNRPERRMP